MPENQAQNDLIEKTINEVQTPTTPATTDTTTSTTTDPTTGSTTTTATTTTTPADTTTDTTEVSDGNKNYTINRPTIYNFYTNGKLSQQDMIDSASSLIKSTDNIDSATSTNINTQQCDNTNITKTDLGTYQNDRNMEELRNKCLQSSYTDDSNWSLLIPKRLWQTEPSRSCSGAQYSVNALADQSALIGTLLPDAENTSVGSIMPTFSYTETTA
jgi:hypothetical protein